MRLWDKGGDLDAIIAAFTVGDDPVLDLAWAWQDVVGSAAHVRVQVAAGMITEAEGEALREGLRWILEEIEAGSFQIPVELEDVHTAVESRLAALIGGLAGKLHTGRSRNDQVLTDLRMWLKERILVIHDRCITLIHAFVDYAVRYGSLPLPGYTHMQRAMPSSYGLWAAGFAGALVGLLPMLEGALRVVDRCPLGSAAGYGSALPLDRALSASLLGFSATEEAVTSSQMLRGLDGAAVLGALGAICGVISRYAADLCLYASAEFHLVRLPDSFTTGSSIMPQKRNPDVAELLRGQVRSVLAARRELEDLVVGLSSGYHRELQLTKAPLLRGILAAEQAIAVATHLVPAVVPTPVELDPELYAASEAFRRAQQQGRPFRETYRDVGLEIKEGRFVAEERAPAPVPDLVALRNGLRPLGDAGALRRQWRVLVEG